MVKVDGQSFRERFLPLSPKLQRAAPSLTFGLGDAGPWLCPMFLYPGNGPDILAMPKSIWG